jgi:hypothetical protein
MVFRMKLFEIDFEVLRHVKITSHRSQQLLTVEEEEAIVRLCLTLDNWGSPTQVTDG